MSLPDIVSTAFGIVARNPGRFLILTLPSALLLCGTSALTTLISERAGLSSVKDTLTAAQSQAAVAILGISAVAGLVELVLSELGVIPATLAALLGRKPSVAISFRTAIRNLKGGLLVFVAWAAVGLLVGSVVLLPLAIWIGIRWSFALHEMTTQQIGPRQALRQSWVLVGGTWWRVFLIELAIGFLASLPVVLAGRAVNSTSSDALALAVVTLAYWIAAPFLAASITVLYADVKLRKGERLQQIERRPVTVPNNDTEDEE
ncbi:MAG TPA: glycerophosphoryl diester phosphodiesterase membrane domain-containing protein [Dehalococcoidia bacterium]|nr:glycerophosphoryl diester phosphodiesterase membrane domain-containing protein [Dehalococcoidia bacterium]